MKNTPVVWSHKALLAINYTDEQKSEIDKAVGEIDNDKSGFVEYFRSEMFALRGDQMFAVFGPEARELLSFSDAEDDRARYEYVPVVVHGQMILQAPEEGCSGMLYLMRCTRRRGQPLNGEWSCAYLGRGWIRTDELNLSSDEIMKNIVREIEAGENVLSNKPAGWV